jgi:c-di-GMP-binding flagellar brake protein YcgR
VMVGEIQLWVNQTLILESEDTATFFTRIIHIAENTISVEYPVNKDHVPMNQPGEKQVSVYFYNDSKEKYMFHTILKYENKKIVFSKPDADSIRKVQKRQYLRVPASLSFWLETDSGDKRGFKTDDVSGGGLSYICLKTDTFKVSDTVAGGINLDTKYEKTRILFKAKIVNVRIDSNDNRRIAVEFIEMKDSQRSKIVQYCLNRQIEIRNILGDQPFDWK